MQKVAIVVREDAYDRILTPLAFAWLTAASGAEVEVLLVNWAARLALPGGAAALRVSAEHRDQEAWLRERVAAAGVPADPAELCRQLRATGRVRIWVCSLAAQIFGVEEGAIDRSLCDGVVGATTFLLEHARGADVFMTF